MIIDYVLQVGLQHIFARKTLENFHFSITTGLILN